MILKFREPVYNYDPDPENPEGPQIRGPIRTYFWHIFGEVSEIEWIDETVTEDYICPSGGPPEPGRHISILIPGFGTRQKTDSSWFIL